MPFSKRPGSPRRIRDSSPLPASSAMTWLPRLDVMMMTVLRKSTVRPWPSVKPAVIEDLEQDVEDVAVGLFDLVEQDDRIRPAP